ncbi:MAG: imidazole glycerol phosphate synthase subunit HisF, partial [Deltaproteobacteria bacterium]|nr:imidazole glycerol phosphate synthase subunit HisF [Deltaproteobacteria bacterium]
MIPVLLLDSRKRLVKTLNFRDEKYVGDPFNVIRLFNEKEVDEICVLDINASSQGRKPDRGFLRELATECFMPLGYGGGIVEPADAENLFSAGIEKVIIGEHATDTSLIATLSSSFGRQAVAACIDCRKLPGGYGVFVSRSTRKVSDNPVSYAKKLEAAGVGEIILQSVDRDGARGGFDGELIRTVSMAVGVPVVALGGAGVLGHLAEGLSAGASAVASGSAF